jgi:hypothetical protein
MHTTKTIKSFERIIKNVSITILQDIYPQLQENEQKPNDESNTQYNDHQNMPDNHENV